MNNSNNIDLNLISVFCSVYTARSVTKAAESLGVTQSAVSHGIKKLREQLNDPLFIKISKEMRPTNKANMLFDSVNKPLDELKVAVSSKLNFDPIKSERTFRLAVSDYIEATLFPILAEKFNYYAPHIVIQSVRTNDFDLVETSIQADLIIGRFTQVPDNCYSKILWNEKFVTIASRNHPRITSDSISMTDFLNEDHVLISPVGTGQSFVDSALDSLNIKRKVKIRCRYFTSPLKIVAESEMIATIPYRLINNLENAYNIKCLMPPLNIADFDISMIWSPIVHNDPAHQWLRKMVIEWSRSCI